MFELESQIWKNIWRHVFFPTYTKLMLLMLFYFFFSKIKKNKKKKEEKKS